MLDVYTWAPNASSGKPLFCLGEKAPTLTHHYIGAGWYERFSPESLGINPDRTIPAIVPDPVVMTETTPAMEYLDDAFDVPALTPRNPRPRWEMRATMRDMGRHRRPIAGDARLQSPIRPIFGGRHPEELRARADLSLLPAMGP